MAGMIGTYLHPITSLLYMQHCINEVLASSLVSLSAYALLNDVCLFFMTTCKLILCNNQLAITNYVWNSDLRVKYVLLYSFVIVICIVSLYIIICYVHTCDYMHIRLCIHFQ